MPLLFCNVTQRSRKGEVTDLCNDEFWLNLFDIADATLPELIYLSKTLAQTEVHLSYYICYSTCLKLCFQ